MVFLCAATISPDPLADPRGIPILARCGFPVDHNEGCDYLIEGRKPIINNVNQIPTTMPLPMFKRQPPPPPPSPPPPPAHFIVFPRHRERPSSCFPVHISEHMPMGSKLWFPKEALCALTSREDPDAPDDQYDYAVGDWFYFLMKMPEYVCIVLLDQNLPTDYNLGNHPTTYSSVRAFVFCPTRKSFGYVILSDFKRVPKSARAPALTLPLHAKKPIDKRLLLDKKPEKKKNDKSTAVVHNLPVGAPVWTSVGTQIFTYGTDEIILPILALYRREGKKPARVKHRAPNDYYYDIPVLIGRRWEDIEKLDHDLRKAFPVQAGKTGEKRTMPRIKNKITPGSVEAQGVARTYLKYLISSLTMPRPDPTDPSKKITYEHMLRHRVVQKFFSIREGDFVLPSAATMVRSSKNSHKDMETLIEDIPLLRDLYFWREQCYWTFRDQRLETPPFLESAAAIAAMKAKRAKESRELLQQRSQQQGEEKPSETTKATSSLTPTPTTATTPSPAPATPTNPQLSSKPDPHNPNHDETRPQAPTHESVSRGPIKGPRKLSPLARSPLAVPVYSEGLSIET